MNKAHKQAFDHHRGKLPLLRTTTPLRNGIFLSITFTGFLIVNAFLTYLSSGRWANFSPMAYWHDILTPLGQMFIFPLSVLSHKWMIPVTGMVLALVIFVPIIISVLYRLVWAMLAVAIVAAVGHAPVLALTLALGCILAARTPLRSDVPFIAVLLGLLPPTLYLMFFSSVGSDAVALPFEQILLKAPLLLAVVAAVLAGAIVLSLARLMDYRSGVVWPVLAVMLVGPMLLFFLKIGSDEMEYNILTASICPTENLLEPLPADRELAARADSSITLEQRVGLAKERLEPRKQKLIQQCERFLARHPQSNRSACVLWICAQAASLQVDAPALAQGHLRYSATYVLSDSAGAWLRLLESYNVAPQAALAQWHLAELGLREGDLGGSMERLHRAARKMEKLLATPVAADKDDKARSLHFQGMMPPRGYYKSAYFGVRQRLWQIEQVNAAWDAVASEATRAAARLNPCQSDHIQRLLELTRLYDKTPMADHLKLRLAKSITQTAGRAEMLWPLASKRASPAYVEANFELGLLMTRLDATAATRKKEPRECFLAVIAGGESPWIEMAKQKLRLLSGEVDVPE